MTPSCHNWVKYTDGLLEEEEEEEEMANHRYNFHPLVSHIE